MVAAKGDSENSREQKQSLHSLKVPKPAAEGLRRSCGDHDCQMNVDYQSWLRKKVNQTLNGKQIHRGEVHQPLLAMVTKGDLHIQKQ